MYEVVYLRGYAEEDYTSDVFMFAEAFADVMAPPGDEVMNAGIEAYEDYHEILGGAAEQSCFSDYTWAIGQTAGSGRTLCAPRLLGSGVAHRSPNEA